MTSIIPETINGTLQPSPEALEHLLNAVRAVQFDHQTLGDLLIDLARMDQLLDRINVYRSLFEELYSYRSIVCRQLGQTFGDNGDNGANVFKLRQLLLDSGSLGSNGVILHAGDDQLQFVSKPPEPEPAPKPADAEFMDDCEIVEDEDVEDEEDHGDNDGPKRYASIRQWFMDVRTSRKIAYIQTAGGGSSDVICNTFDYRSHQIVKASNGTLFTSLYARRNDPIGLRKGGQDYVRITKEMIVTFLRALEVNQSLPEAADVRNALGL